MKYLKPGWFFICALAFMPLHAQKMTKVNINPEIKFQEIEGWGSSLCWWASEVGEWEETKVDSIVAIITSPEMLNMNIFRFNIGGGDDPSHAGGHMVEGKGARAEMEGYKPNAKAPYNWKADAGQRNILLKIKKARPDAVFEAFSNSAPYWMTKSKCSAGYFEAEEDNLAPKNYNAFVDYLLDVVVHYKQEYDIDFKTLEPFNESTSSYWYFKGSQEGCHFDIDSQIKIIDLLYPKLRSTGLNTVIAAADETSLGASLKVLEAYTANKKVLDKIGQINTHTYSGSNSERAEMHQITAKLGKPFWQSETGPSRGDYKSALENNLNLAQKMFNDLKIMKPEAWLDWQLMEENNATWCQIRVDFEEEYFELVKNLYVRMQVTRFIKKGYKIIATNQENVLAAIAPNGEEIVSVIINKNPEESEVLSIDLNNSNFQLDQVYRTSATENCSNLAIDSLSLKQFHSPSNSITTLLFKAKKA